MFELAKEYMRFGGASAIRRRPGSTSILGVGEWISQKIGRLIIVCQIVLDERLARDMGSIVKMVSYRRRRDKRAISREYVGVDVAGEQVGVQVIRETMVSAADHGMRARAGVG